MYTLFVLDTSIQWGDPQSRIVLSPSTLSRDLDTTTTPREPRPVMTPPKLLDRMRSRLRTRHYSIRTEETYVQWAKRYILFQGKKHRARWERLRSTSS